MAGLALWGICYYYCNCEAKTLIICYLGVLYVWVVSVPRSKSKCTLCVCKHGRVEVASGLERGHAFSFVTRYWGVLVLYGMVCSWMSDHNFQVPWKEVARMPSCTSFPLCIFACLLPDALKATSASSTARHDRLLRSMTQCPVYWPTVQANPLHNQQPGRHAAHTYSQTSQALAAAIGMLRWSIFSALSTTLVFADINHIRQFLLLLHVVTACRIACV